MKDVVILATYTFAVPKASKNFTACGILPVTGHSAQRKFIRRDTTLFTGDI
jgi:hypothetical protein